MALGVKGVAGLLAFGLAAGLAACGGPSENGGPATPRAPSSTIAGADASPPAVASAGTMPHERAEEDCEALVRDSVEDMTWFVGDFGLIDYVDVERLPAVIREQCKMFTPDEFRCINRDTGTVAVDKTSCIPKAKRDALAAAVRPLMAENPADIKEAAKKASHCEYGSQMAKLQACKAVSERTRKRLRNGWNASRNPPNDVCLIAQELLKRRLAAVGCN